MAESDTIKLKFERILNIRDEQSELEREYEKKKEELVNEEEKLKKDLYLWCVSTKGADSLVIYYSEECAKKFKEELIEKFNADYPGEKINISIYKSDDSILICDFLFCVWPPAHVGPHKGQIEEIMNQVYEYNVKLQQMRGEIDEYLDE